MTFKPTDDAELQKKDLSDMREYVRELTKHYYSVVDERDALKLRLNSQAASLEAAEHVDHRRETKTLAQNAESPKSVQPSELTSSVGTDGRVRLPSVSFLDTAPTSPIPAQWASSGTPFSISSTEPLFQAIQQEGGSEYFFLDVPNAISRVEDGDSFFNYVNMKVICEWVQGLNEKGIAAQDIIVLSFYNAQVKLLQKNIRRGTDGSQGCRNICTVEEIGSQTAKIVMVDFVIARPVDIYNLDKYREQTDLASHPRPNAHIRDPHLINAAISRGTSGLLLVGQYALLVSWLFGKKRIPNTLFCLAEDLFYRGLIVSKDQYIDREALPALDAVGPRNDAMVARYKVMRDAFVREKIRYGRQRLGIVR
ncbi:MAG: hypothetical protein Q9209_001082 [Squamulea sp. 1 TL-2023]